ncbi:non-canonical purine NTP pyrophosphatase, RdgB/HAM1 family [Marinicauda salina]|uniref:dITP/XTP pyrophosphatase n=1 Tax=Marinicauda salina TaxID=2135793 RepID=A0A2U2BWJ9_9PROT|nr:non-canonical purine NTP pyrophosphatase, RdgB/HAM1 family [Marinicauda salina]
MDGPTLTDPFSTAPRWVIASHNEGKIKEIGDLIAPYGLAAEGAAAIGLEEPEETETSFTGNALLKARAAAKASGRPALADDSGLEVAALDGAPGVYSARWAGEPRDFRRAMERVEAELAASGSDDRSARFVCALALAAPDGEERVYEGTVEGELVWPPRGDRGFGYDPIFQPRGEAITFGEMEPAAKHAMSHRADAFRKLVKDVFGA